MKNSIQFGNSSNYSLFTGENTAINDSMVTVLASIGLTKKRFGHQAILMIFFLQIIKLFQAFQPNFILHTLYSRLLFFSDWGAVPKIERVSMDGSDRKIIVTAAYGASAPTGIAIDKVDGRIYWADAMKDSIESADFNGGNRRTILKQFGSSINIPLETVGGNALQVPFGLDLYKEHMFWTDWTTNSLYRADKRAGGNVTLITGGFGKPMNLHVYTPQVSSGNSG